mmetsp:Transcript_84253/g.265989  ORF Transcript_84253/g.265989 Transcript_84253/m.265989 type:complete len:226 (-) Transcript_84253:125-802(-)
MADLLLVLHGQLLRDLSAGMGEHFKGCSRPRVVRAAKAGFPTSSPRSSRRSTWPSTLFVTFRLRFVQGLPPKCAASSQRLLLPRLHQPATTLTPASTRSRSATLGPLMLPRSAASRSLVICLTFFFQLLRGLLGFLFPLFAGFCSMCGGTERRRSSRPRPSSAASSGGRSVCPLPGRTMLRTSSWSAPCSSAFPTAPPVKLTGLRGKIGLPFSVKKCKSAGCGGR